MNKLITKFKQKRKTANARKWKHQQGGQINWSSFAQSAASNLLSAYAQNKKTDAQYQEQIAQNEQDFNNILEQISKQYSQNQADNYLQWLQNYSSGLIQDQPSQIVSAFNSYRQYNQDYASAKNKLDSKNKALKVKANAEKTDAWGNAISGVVQTGMSTLGSYLANKQQNANS